MKIDLHQLLSADLSDEAAFHLVKFAHSLALALESIYFDQMLHHTSVRDQDPFYHEAEGNNDNPF